MRLAVVSLLLALAVAAGGDDHQTAAAEAAIGADFEVLTRHPDLAVSGGLSQGLTYFDPEVEEPGSSRTVMADSLVLDIAQSMYARVHATAVASDAVARSYARSSPVFDLINFGDDPLHVQLRVRVPGAFPTPGGPPYEPSAYLINGSTDDNWAELARATQSVSVVSSPYIEGAGIGVLEVLRETRPSDVSPDLPPGPAGFDLFGVPFQQDYAVRVPSSLVMVDESTLEIRLYPIGLWVIAEATALSILEATSEPIDFDVPELCATAPRADVVRNNPLARLDPLCRAGRAGEAPVCRCLRDNTLRSQRCSFTFPEFLATLRLPAPAIAGERVDAEWTLLPSADPAEFWMTSEIFVGNKWLPLEDKGKSAGKFVEGKTTSLRTTWTMPSTPTLLRTTLFHLPKGAKKPLESQMTTMVALRKPKGEK